MNHAPDFLFRLVKSLQPHEQKEFSAQLKQNSKSKNIYGKLFRLLADAECYDEASLSKQFSAINNAKKLSVIKVQLREKLMAYVRNVAPETSNSRIHRMLEEAEALYRRNLFADAYVAAENAYNEAEKLDLKYYLIPANDYRMLTIEHTPATNLHLKMAELTALGITNAERIVFHMQMGKLHQDVVASINQNANLRSEQLQLNLHAYLRNPLMQVNDNDKRLSFHTKCQLWITRNLLYTFTGQFELAVDDMVKMKNLLLTDWNYYLCFRRKECVAMLANCAETFKVARQMKLQEEHLTWVGQVLQKELINHTPLQNIYMLNLLDLEVWKNKHKMRVERLNRFNTYYSAADWSGMEDNRKLFVNYLANGYYHMAMYHQALELLRAVKDDFKRYKDGEDMFEDLQIGYFIVFYISLLSDHKRKDLDDFKREVEHYYHRIRRKPANENYAFEKTLLELFRGLKPDIGRKTLLNQIAATERRLQKLFANPYPFLKVVNNAFEYTEWISRCKAYVSVTP